METPVTKLELLDTPDGGSCSCCSPASSAGSQSADVTAGAGGQSEAYAVTGLTCGHCVQSVTAELEKLDGVTNVAVSLVAGGTSTVSVSSAKPLDDAQVAAALGDAGNYQLVR